MKDRIKSNIIKAKNVLINNQEFIKKYFIIFLVVYAVAMFSVIRANFYYVDDMGRNAFGYKLWTQFSRFTSEFLSTFIHADTYLSDVSPLPQIFAILLLIISSIIVIKLVTDDKKISIWKVSALVPLGLCPYFLECLSYRYDSPYMALSILVSVIPFLFYRKNAKSGSSFIIISIICTLIMCTTYQASSGIYLMLAVLLSFKMWINREKNGEILKFFIVSLASYGIGILIFKIFIMNPIDIYISNRIFTIENMISGIFANFSRYFSNIQNDFKNVWNVLIIIIAISFIITSVLKSKRGKISTLLISTITVITIVLLSFGLYPFLTKPLFDPRAMYGFGVAIAIISVFAVDYKKAILPKVACLVLAYMFITFSLVYGNALAEQKRYTDYRINLVINDINNMDVYNGKENCGIKLKGDIGKSKIITNSNIGILNRLVPNTFGGSLDWAKYYFYTYFGLAEKKIYMLKDDINENDMTLVKDTVFHSIYQRDNYILVKLK